MDTAQTQLEFERISSELLRALRGRRTQVAFSNLAGYASNVAQKWESGAAWPTAARFFEICELLRLDCRSAISCFTPELEVPLRVSLASHDGVACLLAHLRAGRTSLSIAQQMGQNRYSVAKWLNGSAVPRLPDFLHLIEAMTGRLVDFLAEFVDMRRVPSLRARWERQSSQREALSSVREYLVWATLQAAGAPQSPIQLAASTGLTVERVRACLERLAAAEHVLTTRGRARARAQGVELSLGRGLEMRRAAGLTLLGLRRSQAENGGQIFATVATADSPAWAALSALFGPVLRHGEGPGDAALIWCGWVPLSKQATKGSPRRRLPVGSPR